MIGTGARRPAIRLGLCAAVVVVPVLLQASPRHLSARLLDARRNVVVQRAVVDELGVPLVDATVTARVTVSWALPIVFAVSHMMRPASTPSGVPALRSLVLTRSPVGAVPGVNAAPATATPAAPAQSVAPTPPSPRNAIAGVASWYPATPGTCASPDIAFGTVLTVTDVHSGATTTCVVNDRGPYRDGRILDLSETTFAHLAHPSTGVVDVTVTWT